MLHFVCLNCIFCSEYEGIQSLELLIVAWLLCFYREDFRKEFQEKNPDIKTMRDVYSLWHFFLSFLFLFLFNLVQLWLLKQCCFSCAWIVATFACIRLARHVERGGKQWHMRFLNSYISLLFYDAFSWSLYFFLVKLFWYAE